MLRFGWVALVVAGCGAKDSELPSESDTDVVAALTLTSVAPTIVDPNGGSHLILLGAGFADGAGHGPVTAVTIEGIPASFVVLSDNELSFISAATTAGTGLDVRVERGDATATLAEAVEAWSPAEISGARLFDAATGVQTAGDTSTYEWQRLTPEISPEWRVRDGNTLTWLPATHKFWMVAGWNGYQEPEGFSTVPPDTTYPPENTTDEVWSSPDGVAWTLELAHGNGQFERRHSHNTVLWHDKLWMIGGDAHQGYYNHDVVSSPDGVNWTVELGPGTTRPPWVARAAQVSGVYQGKLWTGGGQDLLGDIADYTYHNDLWNTEDGVHWTQVAADGPGSNTRWAGCGVLDGFVEFHGEMWLVGCARYRETAEGHVMLNEVWSTTDGVVWRKHSEPPWKGKIWQNVVVWDDKLWILFGYTSGDPEHGFSAGNANETWYSDDGETWKSLSPDAPQPGSHAQGVAVTDEFLLYAGGNYSFGFGAGEDKSAWRLVPFHGQAVSAWTDRGSDGLTVTAAEAVAQPVWVADAFGPGVAGLQFDGSESVLALPGNVGDLQAAGRSVFWVARAPFVPFPYGYEDTYAPLETIVGGPGETGYALSSVGVSGGQIVHVNVEGGVDPDGNPVFLRTAAGEGLQEGPGSVRFEGITHAVDGTFQAYADGSAVGAPATVFYGTPRLWSRIGGAMEGDYYGPKTRFAGTLGAVIVLPEAVDPTMVEKMHQWAQGRFGAP